MDNHVELLKRGEELFREDKIEEAEDCFLSILENEKV